ncbi:NusA-like transcription termination signal-binding factor [Halorientalis pallida]|uniref:Probable transcription termination protein NusA n=1 Tax=Halorientalis pallida TaxID=2479928 RepID=A0A498KWG0_9EURY|nr:NusA-like transcription termination signal-binding factor [Halorientalis pallida]RXK49962.1 NusA-like transcription termination signal-binding factor [Halorientalis pallida]
MTISLSDRERQFLARFEDEVGVTVRDCVVDDDYDRVLFVVEAGEMAEAIGPGGRNVEQIEDDFGRNVELIENADTAEAFVANALAPAAVYNVTISENEDTVAYAEVDHDDTGVAIGKDGKNIEAARRMADRHFDVDDIQLT